MPINIDYKIFLLERVVQTRAIYESKLKEVGEMPKNSPKWELEYRNFCLAEVDYHTAKSRLKNVNRISQKEETIIPKTI